MHVHHLIESKRSAVDGYRMMRLALHREGDVHARPLDDKLWNERTAVQLRLTTPWFRSSKK